MDNLPRALYIVATPIGNLKDITLRALEILQQVDVIAAEDTRVSAKLLTHYGISKKLITYHNYNEKEAANGIVNLLQNGKSVALISDSGLPLISDPGYEIVNLCHKNGIKVSICPGANAALSALVLSGFPAGRFIFEGFLTESKKARAEILNSLLNEPRVVIFYESPHRLIRFLKDLREVLGEERQIAVVRELTKVFEEIKFGNIGKIIEFFEENAPKGEFVIIIRGMEGKLIENNEQKIARVKNYIKQGLNEKEAIKKSANDLNIGKREIYELYHRRVQDE